VFDLVSGGRPAVGAVPPPVNCVPTPLTRAEGGCRLSSSSPSPPPVSTLP